MHVVSRVKKPLKSDSSLAYARNVSVVGLRMNLERKNVGIPNFGLLVCFVGSAALSLTWRKLGRPKKIVNDICKDDLYSTF
jgi:hypothetical protein